MPERILFKNSFISPAKELKSEPVTTESNLLFKFEISETSVSLPVFEESFTKFSIFSPTAEIVSITGVVLSFCESSFKSSTIDSTVFKTFKISSLSGCSLT